MDKFCKNDFVIKSCFSISLVTAWELQNLHSVMWPRLTRRDNKIIWLLSRAAHHEGEIQFGAELTLNECWRNIQ